MAVDASDGAVFERLMRFLHESGCAFELLTHPPVGGADEAAAVRGTPLERGAKSILFKVDDRFALFVLSGSRGMSSNRVRRHLRARRTRFATVDELRQLTGLAPGSVPPFGRPVLPFDLFVDPSILAFDSFYCTAGLRTQSLEVPTEWFREAVEAEVFPFSRPVTA